MFCRFLWGREAGSADIISICKGHGRLNSISGTYMVKCTIGNRGQFQATTKTLSKFKKSRDEFCDQEVQVKSTRDSIDLLLSMTNRMEVEVRTTKANLQAVDMIQLVGK